MKQISIVECPRDAMQGIHEFIPTKKKIDYINKLIEVGFDTIDFGSFVSPKAIPQLRDTSTVSKKLKLNNNTSMLAIVANKRGAEDACKQTGVTHLGYPFSISETFQLRNTNATIAESLKRVAEIQQLCTAYSKEMVVYLSMAFGNPYGDDWSVDVVEHWADKLSKMGIKLLALADTTGVSDPKNIQYLFKGLIASYPTITWGAHMHSTPEHAYEKIAAAWDAGCRRFDVAINGYGGCPMAADDLCGNIATETLISFLEKNGIEHGLNTMAFDEALTMAPDIFA